MKNDPLNERPHRRAGRGRAGTAPERRRGARAEPAARRDGTTLDVAGRQVAVSNLDKILYPQSGFSKADVIDYYVRIAPALLPHLRRRPLTLKRYPNGVDRPFFYEKRCPPHRPGWVRTAAIYSRRKNETTEHCVVDNLPTLVWAANLADLELHPALARSRTLDRPDFMVFDLDPGAGVDVVLCAKVALVLHERLRSAGLASWVKTSGSKGLQLYAPLNTPVSFDRTKAAAEVIAGAMAADMPAEVTANMRKDLRRGKVFIDWSQNSPHKTTVCVYSLRATPEPSVSTPLRWPELKTLYRRGRAAGFRFTPATVLERVRKMGDLFAPVLVKRQHLA
ncbi:MAG TPA: non-homologous end-joining DNA ligase [Opitutus sp.]|nr:non-homologous end-joining DNA ligase [Opitutus sp.]